MVLLDIAKISVTAKIRTHNWLFSVSERNEYLDDDEYLDKCMVKKLKQKRNSCLNNFFPSQCVCA